MMLFADSEIATWCAIGTLALSLFTAIGIGLWALRGKVDEGDPKVARDLEKQTEDLRDALSASEGRVIGQVHALKVDLEKDLDDMKRRQDSFEGRKDASHKEIWQAIGQHNSQIAVLVSGQQRLDRFYDVMMKDPKHGRDT